MPSPKTIPLPRNWPDLVRSGVLHAISLASTALTVAWSRASTRSSQHRERAEIDRLRAEIEHLKEEMAIKDSRWGRHSPRRRPHYGPIQRMRILRLRAARSWTVAQTAKRFLITEATIQNWMRRLDERGEAGLVRIDEPVNKFPDHVAYLVRHLKVLSPTLGKVRIAQVLARAGLHLSASTVGRMLKRDLSKDDVETVLPVAASGRRVRAKRPNDTWHVDLTAIPTGAGFWTPWFPFARVQR
ncbi:MAG: helix-turn-helix domain-containing protein, partial [bacterium]|nr:helix-turn-helix domain-containing protein [bacterium]